MLDLVLLPDERLHRVSAPVETIDSRIVTLAEHMVTTMQIAKGIGLAGVQVGEMSRIFVALDNDEKPRVFINPVITAFSEETGSYEEGCLSIPGVYAEVVRPLALQITAFDVQGKPFTLEASDLFARVIQHEYDHLIGKLFYEYLRPGTQKRLLRIYEKRMRA